MPAAAERQAAFFVRHAHTPRRSRPLPMNANKIGFVLPSNSRNPLPSTRIAVLNMLPFLREAGFDPYIVYEPPSSIEEPDLSGLAERLVADAFGIVFFQKVHGASVEALARRLSAAGIKTVFGVCDLVDAGMVDATDVTVAVTDYLRSLYPQPLQSKIHVVHDGIEHPQHCKAAWRNDVGSRGRPLRAVLVTSLELTRLPVLSKVPPWLTVTIVGNYPRQRELLYRFRRFRWAMYKQDAADRAEYIAFLLDRHIRRVSWDPHMVYEEMEQADIGIIPIDTPAQPEDGLPVPAWKVKSANRLTLMMAMGLPVIATPIPAYEAIVEHGVNGFFAHGEADWRAALESLRDPALRRRMGEHARRSVLEPYSVQEQARLLIDVLSRLRETTGAAPMASAV
jgi:glycosyltransferase involved in cell wall biosynthesis